MSTYSHAGDGGGWSEVRRRPKPGADIQKTTSLYVANIPGDASTDELKALFLPFGKIHDIYISHRKNRGGTFFGFIKFFGISDPKAFENSIPSLKCRNLMLETNLERYPRTPARPSIHRRVPAPPAPNPNHYRRNPIPPSTTRTCDTCSYAAAVSPKPPPPASPPAIRMQITLEMELFTNSPDNLFGSLLSIDHLRNLPSLLDADDVPRVRVYYTGGLDVALLPLPLGCLCFS